MTKDSADTVCSLPPAELEARRRSIRAEILPLVERTLALADGFACDFAASMRMKLEQLVALERDCCASLAWQVLDLPSGRVRLEVRGDGAAALAHSLLGDDPGTTTARTSCCC